GARRKPSRGSRPPGRTRSRRALRRRHAPLGAVPAEALHARPRRERLVAILRAHPLAVLLLLLVDLEFLLQELPPIHLRVEAVPLEELAVRPALSDAPVVEHQDLVRVLHRRDAVSGSSAPKPTLSAGGTEKRYVSCGT